MDNIKNHPLYKHHTIDSAISTLWEFYKQKFIPLFLMSLVMSLISQILSMTVDLSQLQNTTDIQVMLEALKGMVWPLAGIMLASLLFNLVISHYILYSPLESGSNVLSTFIQSFRYFIPYLIIIFILLAAGTLLIGLGIIAFIVGAIFSVIIVVTLYLFIAPILLIENTDISQTIKRTIKLSYTNFWTNIGWVSMLILIIFVISIGLSAIILLPFTGDFIKTLTNPADSAKIMELARNPVYIILSSLAGALTLPLMPIFSYILYFNSVASTEVKYSTPQKDENDGRVRVEDLYAKPYYEDNESAEENINK